MKVHIVNRVTDTGIVSQMAQWLVDHNDWSISDKTDPQADVNYYMPYLEYDLRTAPNTKTAAWFTHYELGNSWKMQKWHEAALSIDLALTTAPGEINRLGFARVITPGVDRDRFRPLNRLKRHINHKPIIGIAGVAQPRKGVHLITDLFYSGMNIELAIIGSGWHVPHTTLKEEALPDFYNHIDVYLCTSLVEGIPMPVLEALACDTKVVIPHGVGICDLLPQMPGIRHYEAGDSMSMIEAIRRVLMDKPASGSLREITEDYTIEQWCKSHVDAMEMSYANVLV